MDIFFRETHCPTSMAAHRPTLLVKKVGNPVYQARRPNRRSKTAIDTFFRGIPCPDNHISQEQNPRATSKAQQRPKLRVKRYAVVYQAYGPNRRSKTGIDIFFRETHCPTSKAAHRPTPLVKKVGNPVYQARRPNRRSKTGIDTFFRGIPCPDNHISQQQNPRATSKVQQRPKLRVKRCAVVYQAYGPNRRSKTGIDIFFRETHCPASKAAHRPTLLVKKVGNPVYQARRPNRRSKTGIDAFFRGIPCPDNHISQEQSEPLARRSKDPNSESKGAQLYTKHTDRAEEVKPA